jgi:small-conductance mechanosensitive channel
MKLNIKALAFAIAILWAFAVFIVGLANIIWPRYGVAFLQLLASVYPGYHATSSFGDLIVGTLYALVDGLVGSLIFGCLYNSFAVEHTTDPVRGT